MLACILPSVSHKLPRTPPTNRLNEMKELVDAKAATIAVMLEEQPVVHAVCEVWKMHTRARARACV